MDLSLLRQTLNSCLDILKASHLDSEKHDQFQSLMRKLLVLQKKGEIRDLSDDFEGDFIHIVLSLLNEGTVLVVRH